MTVPGALKLLIRGVSLVPENTYVLIMAIDGLADYNDCLLAPALPNLTCMYTRL